MRDQLNAAKRDEVLFAFHRAYPRPTPEQTIEWTKNYPEFAEDIRIHAAIRLEWAARSEETEEEPDDLLLRRGRSRALNAIYHAKEAASSTAKEAAEDTHRQRLRSAFRRFASQSGNFISRQVTRLCLRQERAVTSPPSRRTRASSLTTSVTASGRESQ